MLLLDSWSPLVTATCPITGQAPLIPKLRGYFAEFPESDYTVTPRPFQPGAPVSDLGTVARTPFHGLRGATGFRRNIFACFSP